MDQLKESLIKADIKSIIPKLIGKGYAFAYWRMPESNHRTLIVSLSKPQTMQNIDELDSGFVFNRFSDNHPKAPFYIKADIVFREEQERPTIDPRINDQDLSEFIMRLESKGAEMKSSDKPLTIALKSDYEKLVAQAISQIKESDLDKVVLSRYRDIEVPENFSVGAFFDKVCSSYPNAFCSLTSIDGEGLWVGASPELLISNNDKRFKTAALAGTKKIEDGQPLSELAWTQKEIEEQAFVSRYIINCFKKIRLREFDEYGPKTIRAGNLAHLRTEFEVNYEEVQFEGLADQMLDLLHPTSAVCGMPLETAQDFIDDNENYDRSFYSGFLGPVQFEGSTDLFVNLRCMKILGNQARFFAGAGITEDSDPEREMVETDLKMQTLMSLFTQ